MSDKVNENNKTTDNKENKTEIKNEKKFENSSIDMSEEELNLYPERRGDKIKKNWLESMIDREDYNKIICEKKVYDIIQKSNQF